MNEYYDIDLSIVPGILDLVVLRLKILALLRVFIMTLILILLLIFLTLVVLRRVSAQRSTASFRFNTNPVSWFWSVIRNSFLRQFYQRYRVLSSTRFIASE